MDIDAKNCCAILVTYFPDDLFEHNVSLIKQQFPHIIIVDNSGSNETSIHLDNLSEKYNIFLKKNSENLGIAKAMNQGIEHAKKMNFNWLIFFDQDTQINNDYFDIMKEIVSFQSDMNFLAGCSYKSKPNKKVKIPDRSTFNETNFKKIKTLITSGMLVPSSLIESIGGFREDYFIDSVDHEFCLRARKNNGRVLISKKIGMTHKIGAPKNNIFLNFFPIPQHNSRRKYYITRNSIITALDYWQFEKFWSMKQFLRIIVEIFSVILFERNKNQKLQSIYKGIKDALRRKTGAT